MTQGVLGVADFMITFTVLYRERNAPERQAALEMLKTGRHLRK